MISGILVKKEKKTVYKAGTTTSSKHTMAENRNRESRRTSECVWSKRRLHGVIELQLVGHATSLLPWRGFRGRLLVLSSREGTRHSWSPHGVNARTITATILGLVRVRMEICGWVARHLNHRLWFESHWHALLTTTTISTIRSHLKIGL